MGKIDDLVAFVKEQVQVQDRLAIKYDHEPYRRNRHVNTKNKFAELAEYLEQVKNRGLDFGDNSLNRSLSAQKRIQLTFEDLQGLPDELVKELNVTDTDKQEMVIEHIIAQSGGVLSLDKILVELYKRTGEIHKRNTLISRLYRMAQKKMIYNVSGKKGVYSTYEISEPDAKKMFGQDGESEDTSPPAPTPGPKSRRDLQRSARSDLNFLLDATHIISYCRSYEQAPPRNPRSNPHDVGRGIVHALDLARVRRVDQYGHKAFGGRRQRVRQLPRSKSARRYR